MADFGIQTHIYICVCTYKVQTRFIVVSKSILLFMNGRKFTIKIILAVINFSFVEHYL